VTDSPFRQISPGDWLASNRSGFVIAGRVRNEQLDMPPGGVEWCLDWIEHDLGATAA
jgi:hypothetical protein